MVTNAIQDQDVIITCTGANVDVSGMSKDWGVVQAISEGQTHKIYIDGSWCCSQLTDNDNVFCTSGFVYNGPQCCKDCMLAAPQVDTMGF